MMICLKSLFFIAVLIATFESYATPDEADKKISSKRVGVARIFTSPNIPTEEKYRLISLAYSGTTPRMVECALAKFMGKKFRYTQFIKNLETESVTQTLQEQTKQYCRAINILESENLPRDMFCVTLKQLEHKDLSNFLVYYKDMFYQTKRKAPEVYSDFFKGYYLNAFNILPPIERKIFLQQSRHLNKMTIKKPSSKYIEMKLKVLSELLNTLGSMNRDQEVKEFLLGTMFLFNTTEEQKNRIMVDPTLNSQGKRLLDYYTKKTD